MDAPQQAAGMKKVDCQNDLYYTAYMKRTISIKLETTRDHSQALSDLQAEYNHACNLIVPFVCENRCWNRVALHHFAYYKVREQSKLGSQMVCIAIKTVADAYKALKPKKKEDVPAIAFKINSGVHFDANTFSIKNETLSLYTLSGRIHVKMILGDFQRKYLVNGIAKEADLIHKRKTWYFNLVLELPDTPMKVQNGSVVGVDLGENNLAATSTGKLFGGGKLRYTRDKRLALRRRLQRNGSQSAKQLLCKVSGREARHVSHVNHEVSKAIITEALQLGITTITMENLTNIRKRIKAGKRIRSCLHRWAWAELQRFIEYKAQAAGIHIEYVNPAYTSQTCSVCGSLGSRSKSRFSCSCGSLAHSDLNASRNLARLASFFNDATGDVSRPNVATALG